MKTNFEKVRYLNNCFGNTPFADLSAESWQKAMEQFHLITEELDELYHGLQNGNVTEIRDAIADVLVTTYGMAHLMNIDADADMEAVQQSNLSKLCVNSEELQDTMNYYYEKLGVVVYSGGEEGAMWVKSAKDQYDTEGKFYPKGKFLKNTNWHEPVFA